MPVQYYQGKYLWINKLGICCLLMINGFVK